MVDCDIIIMSGIVVSDQPANPKLLSPMSSKSTQTMFWNYVTQNLNIHFRPEGYSCWGVSKNWLLISDLIYNNYILSIIIV